MPEKITAAILILLTLSGLAAITAHAVRQSEQNECLKLQQQSKDYPLFTAARWQYQMCNHYNLPIK